MITNKELVSYAISFCCETLLYHYYCSSSIVASTTSREKVGIFCSIMSNTAFLTRKESPTLEAASEIFDAKLGQGKDALLVGRVVCRIHSTGRNDFKRSTNYYQFTTTVAYRITYIY